MWIAIVAVVAAGGAGVAAGSGRLESRTAWIVVLATVGVGVAGLVWSGLRHARGLRRIEETAERLASTPNPGLTADAGTRGRSGEWAVPAELAPLRAALAGVEERIDEQMKDLAKKGRNLESLIDAIDEPILATDDEDRVLMCNRSAEALLNAPAGGLLERPIGDLFTQQALLDVHAAARAGQARRERIEATTAVGRRVFQVSATPLPAAWGGGTFGAVLALRDVTELAQAVQVKTDFVANASHELRTPVAAIRAAAETLRAAKDDPEMAERAQGMILSHSLRLEEMLRDLLDLSRLESPGLPVERSPVDLVEIEAGIRAMVGEHCRERNLTVSFEIDPALRGDEGLRSDARLLTLILRNLVENAAKFAHEGTTIRVVGTVNGSPAGDATARFEVIDRGVGIPLQHQERVFERYFQADPARTGTGSASGSAWRRGTGLGLAIVKHAAKALGGRVGLTSVWGQGTTVYVEVPLRGGSRERVTGDRDSQAP